LVVVALYATLPNVLVVGEAPVRIVVPALEVVLIALLTIPGTHKRLEETGRRRQVSIALIAIIGLTNALALGYLIHQLLYEGGLHGRSLLLASFDVWATNVIVFALAYWELDG